MKTFVIILLTLIISQLAKAARTCEDYITDEWPDSRYTIETISGDNIVTDNKTGLMWKQCSEGLSGTNCLTGSNISHTWQEALATPEVLNTQSFAGYSDWRLPNIEELRSIAATNCFNPAINETVFPNTPIVLFWSSSPDVSSSNFAWYVYFDNGKASIDNRNGSYGRVRLVRSQF